MVWVMPVVRQGGGRRGLPTCEEETEAGRHGGDVGLGHVDHLLSESVAFGRRET